mgnify:CR=1 FL=1
MKIYHNDIIGSKDLVHIYNEQLKDTPYFYHVLPDEFQDGIYNRINQEDGANLESEKLIIGEEGSKILGFAQVSIGEVKQFGQSKEGGFIHFLTYKSGHRLIGQAILDECEKYLCGLGVSQIWAFLHASNYRFYHLGFGYLSDKMAHVYGLFCMNKYEKDIGEVFLSYPEYEITEPILPNEQIKIVVTKKDGSGTLPNLHVQALLDDYEIGECYTISLGEFYRAKEAQTSFFTKWLGVEEKDQGKGLGRYLLQRTLWEMRNLGYKNAIISTNITNYRAQLFYTNFGYKLVDTAYGLAKRLD